MTTPDLLPAATSTDLRPPVKGQLRATTGIWWKDILLSVSLANLCFLHVWASTPPFLGEEAMVLLQRPGLPLAHYGALILNVLLLSALVWLLLALTSAKTTGIPQFVRHSCYLLLGLLVCNALRITLLPHVRVLQLDFWLYPNRQLLLLAAAAVVTPLIFRLWLRKTRSVVVGLHTILFLLFPLFPLSCFVSLAYLYHSARNASPRLTRFDASASADPQSRRFVFLLFDELDEALLFEQRPQGLALPNIDKLLSKGIRVTGLHCGVPRTINSVPEITTGLRIADAHANLRNTVDILPTGERAAISWKHVSTFISDAKDHGLKPAIVGWFLPYCAVFDGIAESCFSYPATFVGIPTSSRLSTSMSLQWRFLFDWTPLRYLFSVRPAAVEEYQQTLDSFRQDALRVLTDPSVGLVYLHLPVPHGPHLFNARLGRFARTAWEIGGYADSLVLADSLLGEFTAAIERADLRVPTTMVVTADHPYRMRRGGREPGPVPLIISNNDCKRAVIRLGTRPHTDIRKLMNQLFSDRERNLEEICLRLWRGALLLPR